jgi:hypothetical protein
MTINSHDDSHDIYTHAEPGIPFLLPLINTLHFFFVSAFHYLHPISFQSRGGSVTDIPRNMELSGSQYLISFIRSCLLL